MHHPVETGDSMKLTTRYGHHPEDFKTYTTEKIRDEFLIPQVFEADEVSLTYSHVDRVIAGGAYPRSKELKLEGGKAFGSDVFLERRELGVICIEGAGTVITDGKEWPMEKGEGMYIGMGTEEVLFRSGGGTHPKFYLMSSPAHQGYPTVKITREDANPTRLGEAENLNVRTIYKYIHPAVCQSCQLAMGMTILEPGSVWNTMPAHTHDRRMEVYFYFDMSADTVVFHLHGQADETRHIVMRNEQAVISPSWSLHSGVGTGAYTFIWGMAGENQTFTDMDHIPMDQLK
jgi:4-deoxy-L-threo-5-hexosulose-uronate ketol-isomerase